MADFDVVVTSFEVLIGDAVFAFAAGATLKPWKDPVGPAGQPSRIRPHPGQPQLYWEGEANVAVTLAAVVNGVLVPADATLGGRLFTPFMAEGIGPPFLENPLPGFSSLVRFTPISGGHYCIGMRRPDGGAVLVHLDIRGAA